MTEERISEVYKIIHTMKAPNNQTVDTALRDAETLLATHDLSENPNDLPEGEEHNVLMIFYSDKWDFERYAVGYYDGIEWMLDSFGVYKRMEAVKPKDYRLIAWRYID